MHVLAVIAERFAVIRCHDDQRVLEGVALAQRDDQSAHELVRPGHRSIVRAAGILLLEWGGWLVWRVRVIQVYPGKEATLPLQPGNRVGDDEIAGAAVGVLIEPVAVERESTRETRLPIEHGGCDERCRRDLLAFEECGKQRHVRGQWR